MGSLGVACFLLVLAFVVELFKSGHLAAVIGGESRRPTSCMYYRCACGFEFNAQATSMVSAGNLARSSQVTCMQLTHLCSARKRQELERVCEHMCPNTVCGWLISDHFVSHAFVRASYSAKLSREPSSFCPEPVQLQLQFNSSTFLRHLCAGS